MNVLKEIQAKLQSALTGYAPDPAAAAALVKPTQDPKHGDYQANCAMSLAKQLGKKPRDVAQEIVGRLDLGDMLHPPEVAGPGFINFRVREDWLAQQLREMARGDRLGIASVANPKTIVIDFSSPNVAKPLHVGHIRSTIIGDSLTRLLRFLGHKVITDNHLGDWGTQFGMILYAYKNFLDAEAFRKEPVEELARLYKLVQAKIKEETSVEGEVEDLASPTAEAARKEIAKLHAGDPENNRLWQMFMPFCMAEINETYRRLSIQFDHVLGESFYNAMLPQVVQDLVAKGVAQESKGAIAIFYGEDEPPALVRKSDGAFTYTTTDLATIRYRKETFDPQEILYLVDSRQALHFRNLILAAKRWGYDQLELKHIAFGSVLGDDRKPFGVRKGTGALLEYLLDQAVGQSERVYQELKAQSIERGEEVSDFSPSDLQQLYETIGVGAVKYADLSHNRTSDYVFSVAKMCALDGNTATYMQYAYVRNRGIFRRENIDPTQLRTKPPAILLPTGEERALGLALVRFEESLESAAAEYQPSDITAYLWDLAKSYSRFFQACPVLKAETAELKQSRLLLCDLTARVLQKALDLLGIKTVERM